jgi:electron transfer flavoprotein alpha subunit
MSGAPRIVVIAEPAQAGAGKLTRELLGLARHLADAMQGAVDAVLLAGRVDGTAEELIACGADHVFALEDPALAEYHSEAWTAAVAETCRQCGPAAVLVGHTASGADLAPRLAFRLGTGIATGCVAVACSDGKLAFTRPSHGGNARETISIRTAPAIATVRPGCYEALAPDPHRRGEITHVEVRLGDAEKRVKVIERRREAEAGARLEDARVVVAGGRGLNGPDGFGLLEQLAGVLGGAVGASRVPCDLGWCPRSWQIGLTGRTVQPELYIAVGISGAGHHMAGCGTAKAIVAVNTDPDAAIFRDARYGIVGDYRQFVPAFIAELRKLRQVAGDQ